MTKRTKRSKDPAGPNQILQDLEFKKVLLVAGNMLAPGEKDGQQRWRMGTL